MLLYRDDRLVFLAMFDYDGALEHVAAVEKQHRVAGSQGCRVAGEKRRPPALHRMDSVRPATHLQPTRLDIASRICKVPTITTVFSVGSAGLVGADTNDLGWWHCRASARG